MRTQKQLGMTYFFQPLMLVGEIFYDAAPADHIPCYDLGDTLGSRGNYNLYAHKIFVENRSWQVMHLRT